MIKNLIIPIVLFLIATVSSAKPIPLTIEQAIKVALKRNPQIVALRFQDELGAARYKYSKLTSYLPTIAFSSSLGITNTLYQTSSASGTGVVTPADESTKTRYNHSISFGISISDINLFDSFQTSDQRKIDDIGERDRIISSKLSIQGAIFGIISAYYSLKTQFEQLAIIKRQYDFNKSMYELAKQKAKLKKGAVSDLLFAKTELIRVSQEKKKAMQAYRLSAMQFNLLMQEPPKKQFNLMSSFPYIKLSMERSEIMARLEKTPTIVQARNSYKTAKLSAKLNWKSILQSPEINITGYSIGHRYDSDTSAGLTKGFGGGSDLDLSLSVGFNIPIFDGNGFFNHIAIRESKVNVILAKMNLDSAYRNMQNLLLSAYYDIKSQEEYIKDQREQLKVASEFLDQTLIDFNNKNVSRTDMKSAIDSLTEINVSLLTSLMGHLGAKMSLAITLGLKDLPGDKFY
ncbi:MAG: TolC family protein [Bacteriovoracaceae bacterium]|nr:TolC family protein [Bacteriovoracaceae bacterium]